MNVQSALSAGMALLLVTSALFVGGIGTAYADDDQPDSGEELEGQEELEGMDPDAIEEIEQELAQQQFQLDQMQQQMEDSGIVMGEPDLNLRVPNPIVQPGETNEVTIQVTNDGELESGPAEARELVTTARNVEIEADADDTPLTVKSGKMSVGAVAETQPNEAPIAVDVPENLESGTYTIDVDVSYTHTFRAGDSIYERSESETIEVDLVVDDDAQFEIVDVTTDAQIGDTGTLTAEVKNVGAENATDVNVALETMSSGLVFGSGEQATDQDTAMIDELAPNETATVVYDVSVMPDTSERQYMLDATVAFKTEDGLQRADETPSVGVIPQPEQQFSIDTVESDLYVGEDGDLRGVITNNGPSKAENVNVVFAEESRTVIPIEQQITVGSLGPGESKSFALPLDVSSEAEAIDRTIDLAVQYRNADFEQRLYEDLEVVTAVNEQRDEFIVDVLDREIAAGSEKHIEVEVTNNLDETVTDVEANMFTSDPLDSDDDEAFVSELEPGESVTMTFELEAADDATEKTYPISFDFRYDDESGTSKLSDTTRIAIDVVEGGGGLPVGMIAVALLTAAGTGAYVYQRR
ncbi:COG1361 S-layer family protein [Natronolimnohabitans sp. A-GB9]|uniref:COG1361 S-layer family protein n=1 Tax=Natronolimnohabitans sp. A-GB9 TaxID=3069757 RepID=UPI0027AEE925|nr:COG1361 S-layer family protein [Natronolimnohabitans sp. A-GB9]MDQ2049330.1 COG1361 S-layer family protein [Natronolimnohabitans sp. A-GB9]